MFFHQIRAHVKPAAAAGANAWRLGWNDETGYAQQRKMWRQKNGNGTQEKRQALESSERAIDAARRVLQEQIAELQDAASRDPVPQCMGPDFQFEFCGKT